MAPSRRQAIEEHERLPLPAPRRLELFGVLGILVVHIALVIGLCSASGVTSDERTYIFAGRWIRTQGNWDHPLARLHGPLPYLANQLLITETPVDDFRPATITRARLGMLLFTLLTAVVVFLWSREAFGRTAAFLSLVLFAFNPLMLGYAALVAVDTAYMAFTVLTLYLLWRYLERPTMGRLLVLGPALGTAFATKYLMLFCGPLVVAAVAARELLSRRERALPRRVARGIAVAALVTLTTYLTLHAWYGFRAGFSGGAETDLHSDPIIAALDIPVLDVLLRALPHPYLLGVDYQIESSRGDSGIFLNGAIAAGHWDYYLWSFLLKTPEIVFLLLAWLAWRLVARELQSAVLFAIVAVAMLLPLSYLSFFHPLQLGIRYMLPVYPLLFVAVGALARGARGAGRNAEISAPVLERAVRDPTSHRRGWRAGPTNERRGLALIAVVTLWMGASIVSHWPNLIGYYNSVSGGQASAYRHFQDSNSDWGQLKEFGPQHLREVETEPFTVISRLEGPRFGRVAVYVGQLNLPDPEHPGRSRHWLDPFAPARNIDSAWYLFDVSPEAFEQAARRSSDERVRADLALAHLADGNAAAFQRHFASLSEQRAAPLRKLRDLQDRLLRNDDRARVPLAAAWHESGRPDLTIALLSEDQRTRTAAESCLLAMALSMRERISDAIDVLEPALETEASPGEVLLLVSLYLRVSRVSDAMTVLQDASLPPGSAEKAAQLVRRARAIAVPAEFTLHETVRGSGRSMPR